MRAAIVLGLGLAMGSGLAGCTHPLAPVTTSGAGIDRDDDPPLEATFEGPKGRRTKLELRLTDEVSQHLVGAYGGKSFAYVQSVGGAPRDFVAFFATKPACASGRFRVVGTVIEVSGPAKGKATGTVTELELDVERWWCLGT